MAEPFRAWIAHNITHVSEHDLHVMLRRLQNNACRRNAPAAFALKRESLLAVQLQRVLLADLCERDEGV